MNFQSLVYAISEIDHQLVVQAGKAVNISLTLRNWLIGLYIAEYELHGSDRARYGENLLTELATRLTSLKVSNCNKRQLYRYLRFYRFYPQIVRTLSPQFRTLLPTSTKRQKVGTASPQLKFQLFVSKYQLEQPKKKEMARFLQEQMKELGYGG